MNEAVPRFAFFEKVRLDSPAATKAAVQGQIGAVLGRAQGDDGTWHYAVHIYATGICWSCSEHELSPTGEHADRADFYDGTSVRVRVDETGRGSRVSDE
jgi:hypothetical protein